MPDLIRLLHGNIHGIKKLIKEFRVYWLRKCKASAVSENSMSEEPIADESLRETDMDTSELNNSLMEVNDSQKQLDKSGDESALDSNDKGKEEGHGCNISKRQLEIKIMAMATRERRSTLNKKAWYVHDSMLAEFNMSDIELPNTWEYATVTTKSPAPVSQVPTTEGLKTEETSEVSIQIPKDQRSIMDFTLSKKELEIQNENLSSVLSENQTIAEKKNISEPIDNQEKKISGQRSIMDFTKSKLQVATIESNSSHVTSEERMKVTVHAQPKTVNGQRSIVDFAHIVNTPNQSSSKKPTDMSTAVIVIDDEDSKDIKNTCSTKSGNSTSLPRDDHNTAIINHSGDESLQNSHLALSSSSPNKDVPKLNDKNKEMDGLENKSECTSVSVSVTENENVSDEYLAREDGK